MRTLFAFLLALALTGPTFGQRLVGDRPDHVLLTTVECATPGAQVWTLSTNGEAVSLGPTPYVAVVEFRWGTGWVLKKWDRLKVQTPGGLCHASYDKTQKEWTVSLACEVRAPGHHPARVDDVLVSFTRPADLDWDFVSGIPERSKLEVTLEPMATVAGPATGPRAPATVMMAGDQPGTAGRFGTVVLEASVPEAEVIVDGAPAGRTPVRLILREGKHDLTVQKPGFRAHQRQISVTPDSEARLTVTLDPAA